MIWSFLAKISTPVLSGIAGLIVVSILGTYIYIDQANIKGSHSSDQKALPTQQQVLGLNTQVQNTPTIIPTPTPTPPKVQTTTFKPIHDGTRTGPIVDYYSYCDQKTIKVYENERVPFKLPDGSTVYSTKSDIDCFNKNHSNQQGSGQNNLYPTQASNNSEPIVSCTVTYCDGTTRTYQIFQSDCTSSQQQAKTDCLLPTSSYPTITPYIPPTFTPVNTRQQCIDEQTNLYNSIVAKCPKNPDGSWSDGGFCYSYATQGYNQQVGQCQ